MPSKYRGTVTRFAPSPSGYLHLGHAHSALFAWHAARKAGGRFLLRIEDIDNPRSDPVFIDAILEDMAWLGLSWEEPVRYQSKRLDAYASALNGLRDRGLLYPCFCTRSSIRAEIAASGQAPHGPSGAVYPGTCRTLSEAAQRARLDQGKPYGLRLDIAKALALTGPLSWIDRDKGDIQADPLAHGDVVVARKDIAASYHLAVTLDDADQGVTLVTRGEDLFPMTDIHRLLQALLDLPVPRWHHHGLLRDETGERLAKRNDALAIRTLREGRKSPAEVRALAGFPD